MICFVKYFTKLIGIDTDQSDMLGLSLSHKPMTISGFTFNFDQTISDLAGEAIDIAVSSGIQSYSSTDTSVTALWRAIIQTEVSDLYNGYVSFGAVDRYRLGRWQLGNRDFVVQAGYLEYLNQIIGDFSFVLPKPDGAVSAFVTFNPGSDPSAFNEFDMTWADPFVSKKEVGDALFLTPEPGVTFNVRISGVFEPNSSDFVSKYYYLP